MAENYVRTAAELERKYNLSSLSAIKKASEKNVADLKQVQNQLNDFVANVETSLEDLQSQIDGDITTWFYSGVPTLNNLPASEWVTTEEKQRHVGDLYYDNATGYAYRFVVNNNVYSWNELSDSAVAEALAIAREAQDTADGKRRVFTTQPVPPYDVGDLWVQGSSGDIKKCKTERESGSYVASDWELASKYTDDSSLTTFVNNTYASDLATINSNINSKITTWYYSGVPTLNNNPAVNWTTADERGKHVGDLYYDQDTGFAYRFSGTGWIVIHDQNATNALSIANEAHDIATDHKRRIFYTPYTENGQTYTTPQPPYDTGDLWVKDDNKIMACKIGRVEGASYTASDWVDAAKYTADQEAATAIEDFKTTYVDTTFATKSELTTTENGITAKVTRQEVATLIKNLKYVGWQTPTFSTDEDSQHIGELWYNTNTRQVIVYRGNHSWGLVNTSGAQITNDYTPTVPCYKGDIWIKPTTDSFELYVCQRDGSTYYSSDWLFQPLMASVAELNIKGNEISAQVESATSKAEIVTKINDNSVSQIQIDADQVDITANDVLNILANNELNLTSKNITINSNNFSVGSEGNLVCNEATMRGATFTGGDVTLYEDTSISNHTPLKIYENDIIQTLTVNDSYSLYRVKINLPSSGYLSSSENFGLTPFLKFENNDFEIQYRYSHNNNVEWLDEVRLNKNTNEVKYIDLWYRDADEIKVATQPTIIDATMTCTLYSNSYTGLLDRLTYVLTTTSGTTKLSANKIYTKDIVSYNDNYYFHSLPTSGAVNTNMNISLLGTANINVLGTGDITKNGKSITNKSNITMGLSSNQTISGNAQTIINLSYLAGYTGSGLTNSGDGGVLVGAGISAVIVTGQAVISAFSGNATRRILIKRNRNGTLTDIGRASWYCHTTYLGTYFTLNICAKITGVAEGDKIYLYSHNNNPSSGTSSTTIYGSTIDTFLTVQEID